MLLPDNPHNITLGTWISYTDSLKPFDANLTAIQALPDSVRKTVMLIGNLVGRAYHTYTFFGGTDEPVVDDVVKEYVEVFSKMLDDVDKWSGHCTINEVSHALPSSELAPASPITFGQFVDAKMIAQGAANSDTNKWALLQYICSIFISIDGGEYNDDYADESSGKFKYMASLSLHYAYNVMLWFEQLNEYINANYTLFQDSGEPESANMKEHMARWGWINFLKSIAKTKVFDIAGSGLNSIDCARKAKCADVLTWASEEKDYNTALNRDMKDSMRN